MTQHFYSRPRELHHLHRGPLGPHLDDFAELLLEQGYPRPLARRKLRLVADLSRWLELKGLPLKRLDEQRVDDFIRPQWRRLHRKRGDHATFSLLLRHLRQTSVVSAALTKSGENHLDRVEQNYARYLTQERGLVQATLDIYLPVARRFLIRRFGARRIRLGALRSRDVTEFILRDWSASSPRRAQLTATALRSFLHFLYHSGQLPTNLAAGIPTVARGSVSELPQFLESEQVERLLKHCDQRKPDGRRDYAVLMLLARLGLRAGEVVHLNLEDIHWEEGELLINGKSARVDRLPLPPDVGRALAAYLKGRPRCSSRRVFIRAKAPRQGFSGSAAIDGIVDRALTRAQIDPKHRGAHLLRHSLATGMLQGGASLTQIGQILRHRLTQTTEIYAKVDRVALRALAQPWPGDAR